MLGADDLKLRLRAGVGAETSERILHRSHVRASGAVARLARNAELRRRRRENVALLVVPGRARDGVALHAIRIPAHGLLGGVRWIEERVAARDQPPLRDQVDGRTARSSPCRAPVTQNA